MVSLAAVVLTLSKRARFLALASGVLAILLVFQPIDGRVEPFVLRSVARSGGALGAGDEGGPVGGRLVSVSAGVEPVDGGLLVTGLGLAPLCGAIAPLCFPVSGFGGLEETLHPRVPFVRDPIALIGGPVAFVRYGVALVGADIPLVSDPVTLVRHTVTSPIGV